MIGVAKGSEDNPMSAFERSSRAKMSVAQRKVLLILLSSSCLLVSQAAIGQRGPAETCPASVVAAAQKYARRFLEVPNGPNPVTYRPQCFGFTYGFHASLQRGFGTGGEIFGCELRVLLDRSGVVRFGPYKLWDHEAGNPYGTRQTDGGWRCLEGRDEPGSDWPQ
jgi:hypothetical protein